MYTDELMLFALARTYQRHVVVFTHNKCWSTIGSDDFISREHLLEICDLKLLYIGQHMFAELKQKPFIPVTKPVVTEAPSYAHLKMNDDSPMSSAMDLSTQNNQETGSETQASTSQHTTSAENETLKTDEQLLDDEVSALNAADKQSDSNQDPTQLDTDLSDIEQYLSPHNADSSSCELGEYPPLVSNAIFETDYTSDSNNIPNKDLGSHTQMTSVTAASTTVDREKYSAQCGHVLGINKLTSIDLENDNNEADICNNTLPINVMINETLTVSVNGTNNENLIGINENVNVNSDVVIGTNIQMQLNTVCVKSTNTNDEKIRNNVSCMEPINVPRNATLGINSHMPAEKEIETDTNLLTPSNLNTVDNTAVVNGRNNEMQAVTDSVSGINTI